VFSYLPPLKRHVRESFTAICITFPPLPFCSFSALLSRVLFCHQKLFQLSSFSWLLHCLRNDRSHHISHHETRPAPLRTPSETNSPTHISPSCLGIKDSPVSLTAALPQHPHLVSSGGQSWLGDRRSRASMTSRGFPDGSTVVSRSSTLASCSAKHPEWPAVGLSLPAPEGNIPSTGRWPCTSDHVFSFLRLPVHLAAQR